MVKIIIIKAQPKKNKSGLDLECDERVERHERFGLMWEE
jgi:hypothetical protein